MWGVGSPVKATGRNPLLTLSNYFYYVKPLGQLSSGDRYKILRVAGH